VKNYEIPQFKNAFLRVLANYTPKLTFIVVQKRINTKFFKMCPGRTGPDSLENPPPGSILDHTVTNRYLYDFYVVSQHVREGTTSPSHYIVLEDEKPHTVDTLQRLTYKLCFLYYNWPGTVRVPAPCQYAHKLADLVGTSIRRRPAEELGDKLYFL
jgi:aubergine